MLFAVAGCCCFRCIHFIFWWWGGGVAAAAAAKAVIVSCHKLWGGTLHHQHEQHNKWQHVDFQIPSI